LSGKGEKRKKKKEKEKRKKKKRKKGEKKIVPILLIEDDKNHSPGSRTRINPSSHPRIPWGTL
jgi:hypothetical protein